MVKKDLISLWLGRRCLRSGGTCKPSKEVSKKPERERRGEGGERDPRGHHEEVARRYMEQREPEQDSD